MSKAGSKPKLENVYKKRNRNNTYESTKENYVYIQTIANCKLAHIFQFFGRKRNFTITRA